MGVMELSGLMEFYYSFEEMYRKIARLQNYPRGKRLYIIYCGCDDCVFDYAETRQELLDRYLEEDKKKAKRWALEYFDKRSYCYNVHEGLKHLKNIQERTDVGYFKIKTMHPKTILKHLKRLFFERQKEIDYVEKVRYLEYTMVKGENK